MTPKTRDALLRAGLGQIPARDLRRLKAYIEGGGKLLLDGEAGRRERRSAGRRGTASPCVRAPSAGTGSPSRRRTGDMARKKEDPRPAFDFALARYPERLEVSNLEDMLLGSARRSATQPARVELGLSDEAVKNLRGEPERRDLYLVVRIPREVVERSKSLILLPGEGA